MNYRHTRQDYLLVMAAHRRIAGATTLRELIGKEASAGLRLKTHGFDCEEPSCRRAADRQVDGRWLCRVHASEEEVLDALERESKMEVAETLPVWKHMGQDRLEERLAEGNAILEGVEQ